MKVIAVRDDGALLVAHGANRAAAIIAEDGSWLTTIDAALARGQWDDPGPNDRVSADRVDSLTSVLDEHARTITPNRFLEGSDSDVPRPSAYDETDLTAAAEIHTGAMVALLPSVEDAQRIAVDGGEPTDQLHLTLLYLGEGVMIPPEVRSEIIDVCSHWAEQLPTVIAKAFSVNMFNPGGDEPCVVLGVNGGLLANVRDAVVASVKHVLESNGVPCAENHEPWIPHVTLVYTDDADVAAFAEKLGPITFDHIRVAFAGDVYDIPLSAVTVTAATFAT